MVVEVKDLAWAAGFIEADGCFHVDTKKKPLIVVSNSDRPILEKLKSIFFGWGSIRIQHWKGRKSTGHVTATKNCYHWCVATKQARIITGLIFPYLVGEKKQKLLENATIWRVSDQHNQEQLNVSEHKGEMHE